MREKELFEHDQFKEMNNRMELLFENRGIGMFTGEVGCGKSTAVRTAPSRLSTQTHNTVYLYRGMEDIGYFYKQIANVLALKSMYKTADLKETTVDQENVFAVMEELGMK
ncbi:MAG: hypothetical protein GF398_00335 [Chitinivibrionales bacterium]|nr:hypothetical protein [Chitinivibrionales bacterium]